MNSIFTDDERYLYGEGTYYRCFDKFGAHPAVRDGKDGYTFAVWAPDVSGVSVTGTFNSWDEDTRIPLKTLRQDGIWEGFVPGAKQGDLYKYIIETFDGKHHYKADPFAFATEAPPATASKICDISGYKWHDSQWIQRRATSDHYKKPLNIYEVHTGSWKRHPSPPDGNGECLSWEELAAELPQYAKEMGYTHIELMPIMEHPFSGSWGYQTTGYYAPTARHGSPVEFMSFIDACHKKNIGVILDWVPGHFCRDAHGLGRFNGDALYEGQDHEQWGTYKFNFEKHEVVSFLVSNVLFWLEYYHADGIRVDGVSSMLNLNFGVSDKKKMRYNAQGGEEDVAAVDFIRRMNTAVGKRFPGVFTMAEESSTWPLVTMPPENGGLGFNYKWDMGWMNDTLKYFKTDFPFRKGTHELLTFSMMYQFSENFILPLSHDEVVHGKCSLITRMPGDYWRQFAGLRLLYMYQLTHPGAKLNFMGNEIGQFIEWRYYESIEWFLTDFESHKKHRDFVKSLNHIFLKEPALWLKNYGWEGFRWLEPNNSEQAVLIFMRIAEEPKEQLVVLLNFRPDVYTDYRIGVPERGRYYEIFNSDCADFGGSEKINPKPVKTEDIPWHGMEQSVRVTVPPIGGIILKRYGRALPPLHKNSEAPSDAV